MTLKAYVLGKIAPTKEAAVRQALKSLQNIRMVDLCFGHYDFIAVCEVKDIPDLDKNVTDKLRGIDGVLSTETLIVNT